MSGSEQNGEGHTPVRSDDVTDDKLLPRRFEQHVEHVRTQIDLIHASQERLEAKIVDLEGVVLRVERIMTKALDKLVAQEKRETRAITQRVRNAQKRKAR